MIKLKQVHPYLALINKVQIPKKHSDPPSFHCITINQQRSNKKLVNSNSNYLHSHQKVRKELGTLQQRNNRRSQQRQETKATIRQPKQYVPLSKVSHSPHRFKHQQWQQQKQLEYLQSQAYERYLQQICRNVSSSQQKLKRIKSIRSNNIYLANSKQQQRTAPNNHNITYHNNLHSQVNSLSNLSKITQQNNILIQDPFDTEISCQPYLENSSVKDHRPNLQALDKIKVIPYESRRQINRHFKDSFDQKHTVRSSVQLANKLASLSKKSKKTTKQNTNNQTLRINQAESIYNVDFKLKRPEHGSGLSNRSISGSKSQGKKFIIVTSNQKQIRC